MLPLWKDRTWSLSYLSNFLYQLTEKISFFVCPFCHPKSLLLQEYTSFQAFFLLCTFFLIIVPFPPVTIPRLRKATFHHLSHQCLFLASFINCTMTLLLPNLQDPLFPSFPWSLCLWVLSHCLSILHAQGPQTRHFNHSLVTRASSRENSWQAVTSLLPSLMCLYHPSPHPSHMVLCPSCHASLFCGPWRTHALLIRIKRQALRSHALLFGSKTTTKVK